MDVSKVATSLVIKAFEISSVSALLGYSFASVLIWRQKSIQVGNIHFVIADKIISYLYIYVLVENLR